MGTKLGDKGVGYLVCQQVAPSDIAVCPPLNWYRPLVTVPVTATQFTAHPVTATQFTAHLVTVPVTATQITAHPVTLPVTATQFTEHSVTATQFTAHLLQRHNLQHTLLQRHNLQHTLLQRHNLQHTLLYRLFRAVTFPEIHYFPDNFRSTPCSHNSRSAAPQSPSSNGAPNS